MPVKRKFVLGEEWLYAKIYTGPSMQEVILIKELYDVITSSYTAGDITSFFFVRFSDQDGSHLRLRFKLMEQMRLGRLIADLNDRLLDYIDKRTVSKIVYDTYNRELERYGAANMDDVETLFCWSSEQILSRFKDANENGLEDNRWCWGVCIMDRLLNMFEMDNVAKGELYKEYYHLYEKEFSADKNVKKKLANKYREIRDDVEQALFGNHENINHEGGCFLDTKAEEAVARLLTRYRSGQYEGVSMKSLLMSIMHMHYNRLFKSQQRLHELVVYFIMSKVYKTQEMKVKVSAVSVIVL